MARRISDLPLYERPREKGIRYGISSLSDVELLTLIIGSGTKDYSARDIAYDLLTDFKGFYGLAKVDLNELTKYKGIKKIKALELVAIFEILKRTKEEIFVESESEITSEFLGQKYKALLCNESQELLVIILLDYFGKIIHEKILYKGSSNNVSFSLKDVLRELVKNNARSFYLIHNHPDGSSYPSKEDIILTSQIILNCRQIGCPLRDHIIVTSQSIYSFKEEKSVIL